MGGRPNYTEKVGNPPGLVLQTKFVCDWPLWAPAPFSAILLPKAVSKRVLRGSLDSFDRRHLVVPVEDHSSVHPGWPD